MRKEEKTEITRNRIFAAAIQEFGTRGYALGTVNNICRCGINKGLIYHNFKDKDTLYLQCVKKCCDELIAFVSGNMEQMCFVDYMSARMRFFSEHEWEAAVFLEACTNPPGHLEEKIRQICREFDEWNQAVFERELDRFELRNGVSREDALAYFLQLQKVYNLSFAGKQDPSVPPRERISLHEANIKKTFDLLLYGIAKGEHES